MPEKNLEEKINSVRSPKRLTAHQLTSQLVTDFFEIHGDRQLGDDPAVTTGIGLFHQRPITIIGINRGTNIEQRREVNGGAVRVTGYRKALRVIKAAEKFNRPVISFINMPGADASVFSEQHGQSEAIADLIAKMGQLKVINIALFLGEGHSGGALAFSNANAILMLENALFSVASPEAVQAILKNRDETRDASEFLPMTAQQLKKIGLTDSIISETPAGSLVQRINDELMKTMKRFEKLDGEQLRQQRRVKFEKVLKLN
ncbi:carboxyltransferase subunit alpha [Pediococcus damnosus]|uniref:carboxyltransferase subunit alpha n=1 Tax=Pediococcus damnosus TaxID=51663 RepID=UPI003F6C9BA3